jgi:hypothetical protein
MRSQFSCLLLCLLFRRGLMSSNASASLRRLRKGCRCMRGCCALPFVTLAMPLPANDSDRAGWQTEASRCDAEPSSLRITRAVVQGLENVSNWRHSGQKTASPLSASRREPAPPCPDIWVRCPSLLMIHQRGFRGASRAINRPIRFPPRWPAPSLPGRAAATLWSA